MTRVVVVEDNAVFRRALRHVLEREPDVHVVAEAADGRAGIEMVGAHNSDLVLVDVRLPIMDGFETTRAIAATHPATSVIVLLCSTMKRPKRGHLPQVHAAAAPKMAILKMCLKQYGPSI